MSVSIIIDNRESKIYSGIIERDLDKYSNLITIEKQQLEIGDIHIKYMDLIFIYERKTIKDLLSSIKDGRYKEQKARLLSFKDSHSSNINYIIEGDSITATKNSSNQKVLTSVYLNSIYRDKINVFFANNTEETITLLLLLATKIIDKPNNFINNDNDNSKNNQDYIDVCKIKTKKNANIDKDTCYLLQLSQIPMISKEIAKKIKEKYPTFNILIRTLNELENRNEKIALLSKIDGIGNKKASVIIDFLE